MITSITINKILEIGGGNVTIFGNTRYRLQEDYYRAVLFIIDKIINKILF